MPFDPEEHHRRSIRVPGYDYSEGMFFVTICTHDRECLFGEITDGIMTLNQAGSIVQAYWQSIPARFPHVALDAFVIMPNHVHGIWWLRERGEPLATRSGSLDQERRANASPLQGAQAGSVGAIIQGFKSSTTIRINRVNLTPGRTIWQRNYYEHIIRSEKSLDAIRQYIEANPSGWLNDPEYVNP